MSDGPEIREHMAVVGSDGQHVGTVDKLERGRVTLTRGDGLVRAGSAGNASSTTTGPGKDKPMPVSMPMMEMVTMAPNITTSPWAKLIRPMMPYTMVYPSAISA